MEQSLCQVAPAPPLNSVILLDLSQEVDMRPQVNTVNTVSFGGDLALQDLRPVLLCPREIEQKISGPHTPPVSIYWSDSV